MKTIPLLFFLLLFCFTLHAYNPKLEAKAQLSIQQTEMNEILEEVLDVDENQFVNQVKARNKIIIIDEDFNTIREESIDNEENLNNQSMLVPIIYRSEFIGKVYNVSYYMLEKNK